MKIEVRLYATLRQQAPAEAVHGVFPATLPDGATVAALLDFLHIAAGEVHLVMVNGIGGELDTVLGDGDRVGLFPPVGGG